MLEKTAKQLIQEAQRDPSASYWLKTALAVAVTRDPVDAAAEAQWLYQVLAKRAAETFQVTTQKLHEAV